MAIIDRDSFIKYCLRKLGWPVIDINVDPDQVDERVDDAIQFFTDYHYDAVEKRYWAHKLTVDDCNGHHMPTTDIEAVLDSGGQPTDTDPAGPSAMPSILLPPEIISVTRIVPLQNTANAMSMFDVRYQMRLNDLYTFTAVSIQHYDLMMRHLALLEFEFDPEHAVRFNRHKTVLGPDGRQWRVLEIGMDWKQDVSPGAYVIVEGYSILDPNVYIEVWNDRFLKAYATALIKRQWGANMMKFQGISLPGNVQLNGETVFNQAMEEIKELEETVETKYGAPLEWYLG